MCQGEKYSINNIHKVCEGKALITISYSRMGRQKWRCLEARSTALQIAAVYSY